MTSHFRLQHGDQAPPELCHAYYNRGMAFDGKGLLKQALSDLRKALA